MTDYTISRAGLKDCPALNKLINSAYRGAYSRQGWTTEADLLDGTRTDEKGIEEIINKHGSVILKFVEDGKILGCVRLDKKDRKLYLGMLTVEPTLQNKGIGKILLKASEDEARNQNCNSIFMTVISVRNELIGWYKRYGYYDTGKRQAFDSTDPRFGIPKMKLEFVVLEKELK